MEDILSLQLTDPSSEPRRKDDLVKDTVPTVTFTFIQIGMKLSLFIPKIFIQNHFHPKPLSSKTTFIPTPKPQSQPHTPELLKSKTLKPKTLNPKP